MTNFHLSTDPHDVVDKDQSSPDMPQLVSELSELISAGQVKVEITDSGISWDTGKDTTITDQVLVSRILEHFLRGLLDPKSCPSKQSVHQSVPKYEYIDSEDVDFPSFLHAFIDCARRDPYSITDAKNELYGDLIPPPACIVLSLSSNKNTSGSTSSPVESPQDIDGVRIFYTMNYIVPDLSQRKLVESSVTATSTKAVEATAGESAEEVNAVLGS